MGNRKLLLTGAVVFAALFIWYLVGGRAPQYEITTVARSNLVREVSASGRVEPVTQFDLHFKGSGRLTSRSVRAGSKVEAGDVLAAQDPVGLRAQLSEMQAGVDVQKARLAQLLAGSSMEDVHLAESSKENAREALRRAIQDAYTKADDAVRTKADVVFTDPHDPTPDLKFSVDDLTVEGKPESQRLVVENALRSWSAALARFNGDDPSAFAAISQEHLLDVTLLLDYIAQALNTDIGGIDASTLDSWKSTVSAARASVNAASSALVSATDAYATAKGTLAVRTAAARPEDRALIEAQIRQAEAAMQNIEAQLGETEIRAPVRGIVTRVGGEVGEIVGAETTIASLMPEGDLQARVNISEGNIVNVEIGQRARITLDAFPAGEEWEGTVVEIEPAETIVGGVVYYEAVIAFGKPDPRVRRGMTANIWITTAERDNALSVPLSAVERRDGKTFVRVAHDTNSADEREIQTGITGPGGVIEVLSGLSEHDQVVVGEL